MKKLSCILMATVLLFQLCAFSVGALVPESTGPNLIVNGDFSDGKEGWSLRDSGSDANMEIAESMGEDGSDCLYVSKSDRSGDVTQAIPSLIDAKAGESYLISAKIRLATEGATATAKWGYTEGGGYWLGNPSGYHNEVADTATITDEWTKVSVVFTLHQDYLYVPNYFLVASTDGDKGGYYLDDVLLTRVADYVANPNFDYGVAGWTHDGASEIAAYQDGEEACIKVTSGTDKNRVDLRQVSGNAFKSAEIGDVYGVIANVKVASTDSETTKARLLLGGWSWLGDREIPVTDEWTMLSATYVVTDATNIESALGLWIALYDDANATTEFLVDDVAVFKVEDGVFNSGFEYGSAGWIHDGASEIAAYQDGDEACLKVTNGANKDRVDLRQPTGVALKSAEVGDKYCITANVKVASTNSTFTTARLCLGGLGWLGEQNVPVTADEWTQLSVIYEITEDTNVENALGLWVALYDSAEATTEFLVDNVAVFKVEDELFNSGFDYGIAGWTHDGAESMTAYQDGEEACIKVTSGTNKDRVDLRQLLFDTLKSSEVGDKYYVTASVKVASTDSTATKAGLCLGGWGWVMQNVPVTANEWTKMSATYDVTDATNIESALGLWVALYDGANTTTEFLLDDVAVFKIEDELFNSGFDYGTAGWTHDGAESMTAYQDGDEACIKVTNGTNKDRVDLRQPANAVLKSAEVGDKYCVTASVKVASTDSTFTTARLCLGGWAWLGEQNVPVTADEWTQLSAIYEVTDAINIAGIQGLWVALYDSGSATTEFLLDDVAVFKIEDETFNSGFDYGTAGWTHDGAESMTAYQDGDEACIKVISGTNKDRVDLRQLSYDMLKSSEVGDKYYVTASVKVASTNAASTSARLCLGGWAWLGEQNVSVTNGEWTQLRAVYEVTESINIAGAQGLWVVLYDSGDAKTEFLIDDVSVVKIEKGILFNAGFEDDLLGWSKNGVSNTTYTILEDGAPEGNKYLKVQCDAYEGDLAGKDTPDVKQNYDFVGGKTYILSVKYKSDNASEENPVYPELFCNGTWRGGSVVTDNEWTEITTVFTAQDPTVSNGKTILLRQRATQTVGNATPGYTYYLDDFSIKEVTAEEIMPQVTFSGSAKEIGEINAEVTLYNKENGGRKGDFVFIALYSGNGKLVKTESVNVDIFRNSVAKINVPFAIETADETAYAKVLTWNKDLKPYINSVDINE